MIQGLLKFFFGSKYERDIKSMLPLVKKINELEPSLQVLDSTELKQKTQEFKDRFAAGASLDSLLVEAFAVAREASVRSMGGMRPFDVQLMGGITLHRGKIAEMKTGEGKTLTSTLAVYLNALAGKGVHVVTVNDYLARRDAEWMRPIYEFLGLSVGFITSNMDYGERQKAYACDITYGTNNEFGFDYLRDNMVEHLSLKVQRHHFFAIVDEVDSILIDEARTPLIISGPAERDTGIYQRVDRIIPSLRDKDDYEIDEKNKNVVLTEIGVSKVEKLMGIENLYDPSNVDLVHCAHQSLKAHTLFEKDVDYVVQNGEVIIVDEFTGRLMEGRRYSDGLHQAIEAKEHVEIKRENQTLATITFQNFFRMYKKLAGMTGTADTEAEEFRKIYNLDVTVLPPNKVLARLDYPDKIYRTQKEKFDAIAEEVRECYLKGQPVLVGTVSIEKSELLSHLLQKMSIPHAVLNAKYHEREAEIVKEAGQKAHVTIATNMAGRGTDIVLGEGVREVGGLHIIGSERHESRRIDNQLRGRAGRQGDPGSSRFYLALEDDLMRIFGSDRIAPIMQRLGMNEGESIEHNMVSKAIERAQKRVESQHFDVRKHLLEYDDVMNKQRGFVYKTRDEILQNENIEGLILEYLDDVASQNMALFLPNKNSGQWLLDDLRQWLELTFNFRPPLSVNEMGELSFEELHHKVFDLVKNRFEEKREDFSEFEGNFHIVQKIIALQVIDQKWKEHLYQMDHLKEGIWTLGYAERNPLVEYRFRAFQLFEEMVKLVKEETISFLFRVQMEAPIAHPQIPVKPVHFGEAIHNEFASFDTDYNIAKIANQKSGAVSRSSQQPAQTAGGSSRRKSSRRKR